MGSAPVTFNSQLAAADSVGDQYGVAEILALAGVTPPAAQGSITIESSNDANGAGGNVDITAASAVVDSALAGGNINVTAGADDQGGGAGFVLMVGGNSADGIGGDVILGGGTGTTGGQVNIAGGAGTVGGTGGRVTIDGGQSGGVGGGVINIIGGNSDFALNGNGGDVNIVGGQGYGAGKSAGDLIITRGIGAGGATSGQIVILNCPTADPGVAGAVYSDGVPAAGVPKPLMISGG